MELGPGRSWGESGRSSGYVCVLGQFLWDVDPGLPADKAGMKAGDRLVAVAGESVDGLGHEETVSKIREQGSCVSLVVVDPEADRFFSMVSKRQGWEKGEMEEGSGATGLLYLLSHAPRPGPPVPPPLLGECRDCCLSSGLSSGG